MKIECDCMDKEAKTIFSFGIDEAIKRINNLAVPETGEILGYTKEETDEMIRKAKEETIPELEEFRDIVLKMKECD